MIYRVVVGIAVIIIFATGHPVTQRSCVTCRRRLGHGRRAGVQDGGERLHPVDDARTGTGEQRVGVGGPQRRVAELGPSRQASAFLDRLVRS